MVGEERGEGRGEQTARGAGGDIRLLENGGREMEL